jgi:hypothetical protein
VDFGFDVTIAIAAITVPDGYIVTVADRMLSYGDITQAEDNATLKSRRIAKHWALMFSAADANLFLPTVKLIEGRLEDGEHELQTVQRAVSNVYEQMFDREFTSKYLVRYGFDNIGDFRKVGLEQFGNQKFQEICEAIDKFELGIELLCYGYDKRKQPHIFQVSNPGSVTNHDLLGYAVIGSGYWMASASLRRRPLPPDLEAVIYRLLEAKFSAETASGVGKSTTVMTMNSEAKLGAMGSGAISKVRDIWEQTLKTPEPPDAIQVIAKTAAVTQIVDGER